MVFAAILDRDGTLIEDAHYPKDPAQVAWLPGVVDALKTLQRKGYLLFVISNQSGVGRGLITYDQLLAVHGRFAEMALAEGIAIDEYHYCLDAPDRHSPYRKPAAGMLPAFSKGRVIDWKRSFAVGDRMTDLQLGKNAGVARSYLVRTGLGAKTESEMHAEASFAVVDGLADVAREVPDLSGTVVRV